MRGNVWLWRVALLTGLISLLLIRPAMATEVVSMEIYRLAAGDVVADDVIVMANEIYIDGTIQGDLLAFGALVEVNGTVEGDVLAAAAEVRINGTVGDDLRAAGAGVIIHGEVADHILVAAGGGIGANFMPPIGGRTVQQGFVVAPTARVGGGAIAFAGGAQLEGTIGDDILVTAGQVALRGTIEGNADVRVDTLYVADEARIEGQLTYTAPAELSIPAQVAQGVRFEPQPVDPSGGASGPRLMDRLWSLVMALVGFALLGFLLLRFAPQWVDHPARAITHNPGEAALYGLLSALLLFGLPLLSGLMLIALVIFWGILPGVMFLVFLTGALVLVWTLSPLISGLWLGQTITHATGRTMNQLATLMIGVALIVLLGMIPLLGWIIHLASFLLAIGGSLLARKDAFETDRTAVA